MGGGWSQDNEAQHLHSHTHTHIRNSFFSSLQGHRQAASWQRQLCASLEPLSTHTTPFCLPISIHFPGIFHPLLSILSRQALPRKSRCRKCSGKGSWRKESGEESPKRNLRPRYKMQPFPLPSLATLLTPCIFHFPNSHTLPLKSYQN